MVSEVLSETGCHVHYQQDEKRCMSGLLLGFVAHFVR